MTNRLADAQEALAAGEPAKTLGLLTDWPHAADDARRHLLRGHAHLQLGDPAGAELAYRAALELDRETDGAALGLASSLCQQQRWDDALEAFGAAADPRECDVGVLNAWAQTAWAAGDRRVASELVRTGLLRFPRERGFRQLDLALLLDGARWDEAVGVTRGLLADDSSNVSLWQQLAYALRESGRAREAREAIEAAWLANPDDPGLLLRHASAQLAADQPDGALVAIRGWASNDRVPGNPQERQLLETGARAASACGERALARRWLTAIPATDRTRNGRLMLAQLDAREGNRDAARATLHALIDDGESDPSVLMWTARLDEEAGDTASAEALLAIASASETDTARLARLHRARLLIALARAAEARVVLEQLLARWPGDATARAMLATLADSR
jgi:tetratricopeptide (TPR) repeat protein